MARPIGHNNVAAIGVEGLPNTLQKGDSGTEVEYLQRNINTFADNTLFATECGIEFVSVNGIFGTETENELVKLQTCLGLGADGVYGFFTRNSFHRHIGDSPVGFLRVGDGTGYINYNDTSSGIEALDHSWFTSNTRTTINEIGANWDNYYPSTPLHINDGSLIKGENTPDHSTHENGKDTDIRNANLTDAQEKTFLEIASSHPNVERILYYTDHGVTSSKIVIDSNHTDHFHVDTTN
jgi:hypothetical protein